ncbi:MAG: carboxypeptidase-like regulatory domain-containing protein [Bacteroidia bacterium]|nr:carboxypeptidase-like regulatory domain-containing protein [Bacteroidia bacterium]
MKKQFLSLLILVCSTFAFAGETTNLKDSEKANTKIVSGKVVDKQTGEELAGVEVKIADKVYLTDLNGNFSALIPTKNTTVAVSFVSYNSNAVEINPFSYQALVIELESK